MDREPELLELLRNIEGPRENCRYLAKNRWAQCAKPLHGLGTLETDIEKICALTGTDRPELAPRNILVLCADNGVVAEGVSQSDASVTGKVAMQIAEGNSSVCKMAEVANCKVQAVDMGILDFAGHPRILDYRIGNGTGDISKGPAMSREQCVEAILAGIQLVLEEADRGIRLLGIGEMGIGNTTTSSAVASVLLNMDVASVTGRGAGLSDKGFEKKIQVIEEAIAVNKPDAADPIDVLCKVGGFDLAGLCGVVLGGALYRIPVILDGFITNVAALCAVRICPDAKEAILASHVSSEPAAKTVLDALGLSPLISAEMHLGEGTGAATAMPLLDMALSVYLGAYTFEDGDITPYTEF